MPIGDFSESLIIEERTELNMSRAVLSMSTQELTLLLLPVQCADHRVTP